MGNPVNDHSHEKSGAIQVTNLFIDWGPAHDRSSFAEKSLVMDFLLPNMPGNQEVAVLE